MSEEVVDTEEITGTEEIMGTEEITGTEEVVTADETAVETTVSSRRGRPRPDEVITRDDLIFEIVESSDVPLTRKQIAATTGVKESHVYLSLLRLRNAGRLQLKRANGSHLWSLADDTTEVAVIETPIEVIDESAILE